MLFLSLKAAEKQAREEQVKRGEEEEAKLSVQLTALNENVATLKRECQTSQKRVSELEKQTDELRGDIAVLEATVQNNQDERRALLERCVIHIILFNITRMKINEIHYFRIVYKEEARYTCTQALRLKAEVLKKRFLRREKSQHID